MGFGEKMKNGIGRFMTGRHGPDPLGVFTLFLGLILSIINMFVGNIILSLISVAMLIFTIFRMFSRNNEARMRENQKFVQFTGKTKIKTTQFFKRLKYRKDYKYFKCPNCKVLMRLKRGCGDKQITCSRCGHQFSQKA